MIRYLPVAVIALGAAGRTGMTALQFSKPANTEVALAAPQPVAQPVAEAAPTRAAGLFGVPEAPVVAATRRALPHLTLTGVMRASDPTQSQVLIRQTDGSVRIFRIGDTVSEPFLLTEIAAQTITLSDGADSHIVRFDVTENAPAQTATAIPSAPFQTAAHRAISAKLKKPETTQEHIDYWRERIRRNPGEVLSQIGLVPTDGGYRIARKQNIGVRLAGFRAGDLITSVNGLAVGNADKDRKQIDAILAEGLARVTFERGGESRTFTFPLR